MARHEFQPGKLVAGLFLTTGGVVYAGDAGGWWDTPWFVMIPLITGGLCLAGAVALLAHGVRRHRAGSRRAAAVAANGGPGRPDGPG
ncbi:MULTISPECIES: hypothetical protein [unclassified Streptomyces]|uniref:hypothetical protein n=1 Tax=unclassified Streptomyces TaxID=2593676 RepID=UPI0011CDC9F4|nr:MULTISPECIES: hypothetical protein [unclassified Streptomyces]TXS72806.1 hypothetical protein EAO69_16410 [Streptomyces sp. me109]